MKCKSEINCPEALIEAVKYVERGDVVIIPTENVYAFIFSGRYTKTIDRVYSIKKRPRKKGFVVCTTKEGIFNYANLPPEAQNIVNSIWPAPVSLVLKKKPTISDEVTSGLDSAAFMCLKSPVISYITENAVGPVCATTCNISGQPEIHTFEDAVKYFGDLVDLIIKDDSLATYGIPTTIVSFVEDKPTVLRVGGIPPEELKEKLIPDLVI
jgi:Sua5/YciO/YrdC/YwlC family protein